MARRALVAFVLGVAYHELGFVLAGWIFQAFAVLVGVGIIVSFLKPSLIPMSLIVCLFLVGLVRGEAGPVTIPYLAETQAYLSTTTRSFSEKIVQALPEPQASYLGGLLVGARSDIPSEVRDNFRETGTSHLVALSGFNVTIIVNYLGKIFSSLWFPAFGIILFVLATGAQSSLVRAAIMGILALLSSRLGHNYQAGTALLFAASIMLFFDPTLLFGDIGFQLSVAATWGLVYLAPSLTHYLRKVPNWLGFRENLALTLAAQAATFPFIFYYFGGVSYWAPLVNILVLVAVPPTMFFGFLTGMLGFVHPLVAQVVAWPTWLLLTYQLRVIEFFAARI